MLYDSYCEKWRINGKFAYSKKDFTIWEIEGWSQSAFDDVARVRIQRWPTGTDAYVLTIEELCDKFYTLSEYKEFYEEHKDCIVNAPYEVINDPHDDIHDEKLTFIHLISDSLFLYKYEYVDSDGHHDHLIKLPSKELSKYENNKSSLFDMVHGLVLYLEQPINEW